MIKDKEVQTFLKGVVGVVEATRFEQSVLWERNNAQVDSLEWQTTAHGIGNIIGHIGKRPINLGLNVVRIDGMLILFVEPLSELVDHVMIRKWLDVNMPPCAFTDSDPREKLNLVDAQNFHNVFPRYPRTESPA